MKKATLIQQICFILLMSISVLTASAQTCTLTMSATTADSRCKATGSIIITVANGSGNYNYTVTGSTFSTNTSSNIIGGLEAGVYDIKVKDLTSGCTVEQTNITVAGDYQDPRFTLAATQTTCANSSTGSITVNNVQYGRAPFAYKIVAPSASGVGTTNSTGVFANLPAGNYTIQLSDSCGGKQTRVTTIADYDWSATVSAVTKPTCDSFETTITVTDAQGNTNIVSPALFSSFIYGGTAVPGDTTWSASNHLRFIKAIREAGW